MIEIKCKSISPAGLAALLGDGNSHEVLDVRTPPEFARAHVPGARLVPLNELRVDLVLAKHKRGTPIYVVCQAGPRARKAVEQFERSGCEDCVLVEGGTQAAVGVTYVAAQRDADEIADVAATVQQMASRLSTNLGYQAPSQHSA